LAIAEIRTPDPLIKSQGQSGPEPNIDKKAQPFSTVACFFFDDGKCMFCPGSGTERAQQRTQGFGSHLQATFAGYREKLICILR
jgi:hypothetical protein